MEKKVDGRKLDSRCNKSSMKLNRQRSWKPPSVSSFCRPLIGSIYKPVSWHEMLLLPPYFAATIAGKVGQEVELKNALGEKWPVIFSSYGNTLALQRGWKDFMNKHKLEEGNFLVFRSIGLYFKVEVYKGSTFCEKACHGTLAHEPPSVARFFKPLINYNWDDRLVLPLEFSATVADKIGQETKLKNALGEKWTVTFSSYEDGKVAFERGWKEFVQYHNLEVGDILVFRGFDNGSLFDVEVYDGETYCEKACPMSLIRTQHGKPVPVYSNSGGNIGSSSVPLSANMGPPPDQDTVSNAVIRSPPRGRHVREQSYVKRKIGTSFEIPIADLGSPPKQANRKSRGAPVAVKGAVSNKGMRSPQGISNVNQVETESPTVPLPYQGPVTCLAVTSGRDLVLPGKLPGFEGIARSGLKNILLLDEGSRFWSALLDIRTSNSHLLTCSWDVFNAKNGVQAGDRYSITAEFAHPSTYKINILRST